MHWFLKLIMVWLSLDLLIVATIWYLTSTIKPHFPTLWKQHVIDEEPYPYMFQK